MAGSRGDLGFDVALDGVAGLALGEATNLRDDDVCLRVERRDLLGRQSAPRERVIEKLVIDRGESLQEDCAIATRRGNYRAEPLVLGRRGVVGGRWGISGHDALRSRASAEYE